MAKKPQYSQNEMQQLLLSRFQYADNYRQDWENRAINYYSLYTGYRHRYYYEHSTEDEDEHREGRSRLHIPKPYELIDGVRARIVKSFTANRPYIEYLPKPDHPSEAGIKAFTDAGDKMTAIVDDDLDRNNYPLLIYQLVTAALIYPCGVLTVGWRHEVEQVNRRRRTMNITGSPGNLDWAGDWKLETVQETVTTWDNNEVAYLDWFDHWRDPRGRTVDIDQDRFNWSREWMTQDEIEEWLDLLRDSGCEVYPVDFASMRQQGSAVQEGRWERQADVGHYSEQTQGQWAEHEASRGYLFEVLNYWEHGYHGILINRMAIAAYGESPFWHRKIPFVVATFDPLPGEVYGICGMQVIEHLSHELDTHRNQRIDNVSFILNAMWRVNPNADIDESELYSAPHHIIHAADGDVEQIEFSDITKSGYMEEQITKADMDGALGTLASMPSPGQGQSKVTATQQAQQTNANSIRNDVKSMIFDSMGVKRLAFLLEQNNQQFLEQTRMARRYGVEGPNAWLQVQPQDVVGFNYEFRGGGNFVDPAANKELRRNQLLQLYEICSKSPNPYVDMGQLTKLLVESFDIKNVDKVIIPPEQQNQGKPGQSGAQPGQMPGATPGQTMPGAAPAPQAPPAGQIPGQNPGQQPPQPAPQAQPGGQNPGQNAGQGPAQLQQLLQALQSGQVPPQQVQQMLVQLLQSIQDPQAQQVLQAVQSGQMQPQQMTQLLIQLVQQALSGGQQPAQAQPQGQPGPGQPVAPISQQGNVSLATPQVAPGMTGRV